MPRALFIERVANVSPCCRLPKFFVLIVAQSCFAFVGNAAMICGMPRSLRNFGNVTIDGSIPLNPSSLNSELFEQSGHFEIDTSVLTNNIPFAHRLLVGENQVLRFRCGVEGDMIKVIEHS